MLLKNLLIHQVGTDGGAYRCSQTSLLFWDDARSERDFPTEQVFCLMRSEKHTDGNIVGDITNDGAY